ncbi:MAG: hypothetical protein COS37_01585 [Anaerolineae bacterium CG03_land_8_20_14_0_80_58_20]|nr:MAG: hypothetical protein COS37_01585 [Anaerolineae bacterium CG03_land_8_20_14_0_80_58_20]
MPLTLISWIVVGLLLVTSIGLLLSRDWRWSLGFLAAQYLGMFWLVTLHWPFGLASVKLVTGWMASATLGVTRLGMSEREQADESAWPQGHPFRLFAAALVVILVIAATPQVEIMIPGVSRPVITGGLLLTGMGLLHLGITAEILRITLGLLTVLAGFEILYATVETSILLAGLLAIVNLGLALAGAYLMTAAPPEEAEEVE